MARKGFLAALQRASRQAAKERERNQRAAIRTHQAAARDAQLALRRHEQLQVKLARASAQDKRRLEKEAKEAHLASMEAQVEERNSSLEEVLDDLDTLLSSTLGVDDYVDLNSLMATASHPPFDRSDLESPIPPPVRDPDPPRPVYEHPPEPTGLSALFGKKKHAQAVETARKAHEDDLERWRSTREETKRRYESSVEAHAREEARRVETLAAERQRYDAQCAKRARDVTAANEALRELIANLGYGATDAVQEYISIVLANSAYPSHFPVTHSFAFEPATAELRLRVAVPAPADMPTTKSYKYVKSADEIVSTDLPQRAQRDRYADVVRQVALRSFHEVFESDRRALIKTVSLEVGTEAIDPATGRAGYVPLLAAAAERELFLSFDLSSVVPAKTLDRLGASISKAPFDLVPAVTSGVRRS
jgi:restriction system protein